MVGGYLSMVEMPRPTPRDLPKGRLNAAAGASLERTKQVKTIWHLYVRSDFVTRPQKVIPASYGNSSVAISAVETMLDPRRNYLRREILFLSRFRLDCNS